MNFVSSRNSRFRNLSDGAPLDVLIVGGGMTGAPLYHALCRRGYRVALIDKADFSSGTSQASGMLIWGGLLYLKNLDFSTVLKLCKARRVWLEKFPGEANPLDLNYPSPHGGMGKRALIWLALHFYWLLGGCSLNRPFHRKAGLSGGHASFVYQEGMLRASDSRFVIDRIRAFDSEHCIPLNYCRMTGAGFDRRRKMWRAELRDETDGAEFSANARVIVNGAGVWTDELNRLAGLESPYKHVFSKGVYLALPGDRQTEARIYPVRDRDDVLTYVPWGPVMMWGPTETKVRDLESGLAPDRDDLRFLLENAKALLPEKIGAEDVISIRCGIRPLAVPRNFDRDVYPLDLSRRHQVVVHKQTQALSLYGGKLTSSLMVAERVAGLAGRWVKPRHTPPVPRMETPETRPHPRLGHHFVTPEWARDHEFCVTLDDYLRRRTNIAQWTPRMGLGTDESCRASLLDAAATFSSGPVEAAEMVNAYEKRVRNLHDPLLAV